VPAQWAPEGPCRTWSVSIVRKDALFPLKTGHLMIEPMSLSLPQARAGKRESERLAVDIGEPPRDGRPAGYALGDVGDMALSATVSPRTLEQGGAVGVTIELRGTGNLPSQLALPVQQGVDWLDAQTRDDLKAVSSDRFGGTRTFSYVVRVHKAGPIDLGEVRLPFWDPDRKAYSVARASLGVLDVAKGNEHLAAPDEKEQVLPGLPKPRMTLEGQRAESYLAERPVYWGLLFGSPLACVFAIGAHGAARRLREKRAAAAPSPERIAKERRAEADAAAKGDDAKAAMGAIARAIEAGVLAKTGVNVRGGDGATIARELEDAGVSSERTKTIVDLLRTCEDARFSPDGVTTTHARETWKRAEETLDDLGPEKKA